MTAYQLYEVAKKILFAKSSAKDYDQYYLTNLVIILNELFEENNAYREFDDKLPLTERYNYSITADTEINYEDPYLYEVIPHGLAYRLSIDDGDGSVSSILNTDYMNARSRYVRCNYDHTEEIF